MYTTQRVDQFVNKTQIVHVCNTTSRWVRQQDTMHQVTHAANEMSYFSGDQMYLKDDSIKWMHNFQTSSNITLRNLNFNSFPSKTSHVAMPWILWRIKLLTYSSNVNYYRIESNNWTATRAAKLTLRIMRPQQHSCWCLFIWQLEFRQYWFEGSVTRGWADRVACVMQVSFIFIFITIDLFSQRPVTSEASF